jgi:hypothetical protein
MSEDEVRQWVWDSCTKRIVAMIDEYSSGWAPNGPSAATASAICNKIRNMPVPLPQKGEPQ